MALTLYGALFRKNLFIIIVGFSFGLCSNNLRQDYMPENELEQVRLLPLRKKLLYGLFYSELWLSCDVLLDVINIFTGLFTVWSYRNKSSLNFFL